ncbi:SymE family type I addiction module toxin [Pectobacterium carotovorum]|uniref:SymE family type I addiction module toxin n=1 Tax=Pectobacterium carotovorum TaxID=554 RepID=UPI0032F00A2A
MEANAFQAELSATLPPVTRPLTRTFAPDTLPPCSDFPVCLCHIITATAAAAISRFINEPGFLAALLAKLDDNETESADWVSDYGELALAGDWLTLSGLLGQPLMVEMLPGKIIIRVEMGTMLA